MAKLISKTYGEALFELAIEEQKIDVFQEEIEQIEKILESNPEFSQLMNHPKITKEEKTRVAETVFKGRISGELMGFISLVISKDRYSELDAVFAYFIAKVKEEKGIGTAYVTTAVPLRQEQKKLVEEKLLETTRYRSMEMHYGEDHALIGGMVIRIGDRVVDSSIRTKLQELQRQLMKIQLVNV